jgi:eukaryotic-like serine/threonine-protein kinase
MPNNRSPDGDHTLPHTIPPDQHPETVTFPDPAHTGNEGTPTFVLDTPELPAVPGYTVTREVARGGMGVVYAAHDPVFDREVAVKVMYPGQDAGRFVVEAKVTANLSHPGIPPVHSLGTMPDGRPYLTMKLIRGRTLANELKESGPADLPRLLDIFQRICQTVGFAHANGIVHRDLKPTNVMVGAFGEVQVMDWGLAKELRNEDVKTEDGATSLGSFNPQPAIRNPQFSETVAGQIKGTPAYMAPEQARGESVDARADVFALGGILAAVLTGAPPFAGNTVADTVAKAAQADLGACFAALDACGADAELVAVAKKCLAAHAGDRFASGEDVATAVAAYRAGVEERLRRSERERVAAEAKAVEEVNTRREAEARADAERANAAEQQKRRRSQLGLAAAVVLLVGVVGAFAWWQDKQAGARKLADERAAADRERAETERVRIEAEGKAAAARLAGERDAEARNKVQQARQGVRSGLALATDLRKQYKFKQAAAALAQAMDLAKGGAPELLPEIQEAQRALGMVVALDDVRYRKWAWVTEGGGRGTFNTKSAPPEYRRIFAEYGLDLAVLAPANAAERIATSTVKAELVTAVDDWALFEPDAVLRDQLLEVARRADPGTWTDRLRDPAVWGDRTALARLAAAPDPKAAPAALGMLAELMWRKNLDPAPFLSAARAKHPTDFELALALGQWYANNRDGQQIGPYEAARTLRPDNPTVWKNLGVALGWKGDLDGEIAAYREAARLDPRDPATHSNLGVALREKGDLNGAIAAAEEAIRLDPQFPTAYDTLGNAFRRAGDLNGAIAAFREAVRLDPKFARAHNNLGAVLRQKGDLDGAIAAYKDAIRADARYGIAYSNLGAALHTKGDLDGALAALTEAVRLNPKFAPAHSNLGLVLQDRGDPGGAVGAYQDAIRADPRHSPAYNNLAILYFRQQKYPDAIAAARAAIKIDPKYASAYMTLGRALQQTGDIPGARAALTEAARLDKQWAPLLVKLPPLDVAPPPREKK